MGRWADQENDKGRDNRATERDHRGSEPTDQPGTVGPRPDPLGLRREGRHTPQCPDRVHLARLGGRHVDCEAPTAASRPSLDVVDGIPDEYLQASGTYEMTPEQRVDWEAGVRSLYDGMVRIVVTPTWAKLIDFQTTLPSAVEELVRQRDERQRA